MMAISKNMVAVISFSLLLSLLDLFTTANAASFDCAKATTLVENAICSNPALSGLEDQMASLYSQALGQSANTKQFKEDQRAWLKKRNNCQSESCIKQAYQERLSVLRSSTSNTAMQSPSRPGECVTTKIVEKSTRFEGAIPGESGGEIHVSLANNIGLYLTDIPHLAPHINANAYMARTHDFAKGDKVKLCLLSLPQDCPPGDDRGKVYSVTNLKNQMSFTGVDAWHLCGGA